MRNLRNGRKGGFEPNPTAAVFMDHSHGTYPIRVLTD